MTFYNLRSKLNAATEVANLVLIDTKRNGPDNAFDMYEQTRLIDESRLAKVFVSESHQFINQITSKDQFQEFMVSMGQLLDALIKLKDVRFVKNTSSRHDDNKNTYWTGAWEAVIEILKKLPEQVGGFVDKPLEQIQQYLGASSGTIAESAPAQGVTIKNGAEIVAALHQAKVFESTSS